MSKLATVRIVARESEGGFMIINESDFQPGIHELYQESMPACAEGCPICQDNQHGIVKAFEEQNFDPPASESPIDSHPGECMPKHKGGWPKGKPRKS
jgi:hypothetical protein